MVVEKDSMLEQLALAVGESGEGCRVEIYRAAAQMQAMKGKGGDVEAEWCVEQAARLWRVAHRGEGVDGDIESVDVSLGSRVSASGGGSGQYGIGDRSDPRFTRTDPRRER